MIINTALEIYDSKIITMLKQRFASVPNVMWNYSPPDLAFVKASEKYGDEFLPLYSAFRIDVPQIADERSSLGNFTIPMRTSTKTKTIEYFKVFLRYQLDFYSLALYDMNLSIMDFYRFKKNRMITFDFSDIGLPGDDFNSEVIFEDPEEASNINDDKEYEIGRYYRYTYGFTLEAVLFDITTEVETEQIVFDMYSPTKDVVTKVANVTANKQ